MLTGSLKASQHFFSYQDVADDYQVICMLENKLANASEGDIIEIKLSNRKPVKKDIQFWLKYTINKVVSIEENESEIVIRVIKTANPSTPTTKDFKICDKTPECCNDIIDNIYISILKGEQVNLFFEKDGILLLSNAPCKRNFKHSDNTSCNLQSHKDKLAQLNMMGVTFHVKNSGLNEYNLNKNNLLISNISIE